MVNAGNFEGVRFARLDEVDRLYDFLLLLHEENGMFDIDERKGRATLVDLLTPPLGVIGVIDGPTGIEAAIGLYITAWWYTRQHHITEFFTFVKKEARRSTHARHLIDFAKWYADGLELPLHVGIITTHRSEAKQKLYRRMLPQVGGYYLYRGDRTRLGDQLPQEPEGDGGPDKLLTLYHGAAKRLVGIRTQHQGRPSKQELAERDAAMRGLKEVVAKADAALNHGK